MNKEQMSDFEKSLLDVLNDIDNGKILLLPDQVKKVVDNIDECLFHFDVGKFVFVIFNDCGEWDYVSEAWRGGKKVNNYQIGKYMPSLYKWRPKHPEYWGMK